MIKTVTSRLFHPLVPFPSTVSLDLPPISYSLSMILKAPYLSYQGERLPLFL